MCAYWILYFEEILNPLFYLTKIGLNLFSVSSYNLESLQRRRGLVAGMK